MSDLRSQLTEDVATVSWSHLKPHVERGAVILVDDALDLVDVAIALAEDNTHDVAAWLQTSLLTKPTADDHARLTREGGVFQFLIVQPWVIVRPMVDAEA